jgi:predicted ATPase
LTGKLPFPTTDLMELIHCHIAVEPQPLPPSVPRMLNNIILKLLKKDASERYQSCQGLLHDLQFCQQTLSCDSHFEYHIPRFNLAQNDFVERFNLPKRLYGRDEEASMLMDTFDHVATTGETSMLLVSGYSGIGKSSLVREVQRSVQVRHGYFASGKFDQLERNVAYSAITEAFQILIKQIQGEGEERIEKWQKRIQDAISPNGQVIVELIPDVERLIGKQPPILTMAPQEAKNRLDLVLEKFVGSFIQQESPLVLFLDDLQWADRESVNLIRLFLENSRYMLFVGAYRSNEVTPLHPAMQMITLMRAKLNTKEIILAPLSVDDVHRWVSDTLQGSGVNVTHDDEMHDDVRDLAEMVHKKTEGNPFFFKMFFMALHAEGAIVRDGRTWKWDLNKIRQQRATDNVVDLMTHRINQFTGATEQALNWASCMGNNLDFNKLALLMERPSSNLLDDLYPVLNAGMVIMLHDRLHFAHDRVQEATYARLDEHERHMIHYTIGRRWLQLIENQDDSNKSIVKDMFEVVDQLNKGVAIFTDPTATDYIRALDNRSLGDQLEELAKLNFDMAKHAQEAAAYSSALNYLKAGVKCSTGLCNTEDESWEKHHDLIFSMQLDLATVYSLIADYESSNRVIEKLLQKAKTKTELSSIYTLQILQENVFSRFTESLQIGRIALKQFGIDLPPSDDPSVPQLVKVEIERIVKRLEELRCSDTGIVDISPLLVIPDTETQSLYTIIAVLLVTAYLQDQIIFPLMAAISVRVMLDTCVTSTSTTSFAYFAIVLEQYENYAVLQEFSDLVVQCMKLFRQDHAEICRSTHLYNIFIHHWFRPIRELIPSSHEAMIMGVESGETTYATYVYSALCPIRLYVGDNIDNVLGDIEAGLSLAHKYKNHIIREIVTQILCVYRILQGSKYSRDQKKVDEMEENMINNTVAKLPRCQHLVFRLMLNFMFEDDYDSTTGQDAITYAKNKFHSLYEIDKLVAFISSMYHTAVLYFFESLTLLRIVRALRDSPNAGELKEQCYVRLERNKAKLKLFSNLCHDNFSNKLLLVEAEYAAYINNEGWSAMKLYEEYDFFKKQ